jgi:hypothetical protein
VQRHAPFGVVVILVKLVHRPRTTHNNLAHIQPEFSSCSWPQRNAKTPARPGATKEDLATKEHKEHKEEMPNSFFSLRSFVAISNAFRRRARRR